MNIAQKASQDLHLQGLIVGIPVRLALLEFISYIQLFKQKAQSWDASSILHLFWSRIFAGLILPT